MKPERFPNILAVLAAFLVLTFPRRGWAQFTYTTNNGTVTITGYGGPRGFVTIPGTINGYPVTAIAASAFSNQSSVIGVTFPNSITSIGDWAFYACSLGSVTIPGSVTNIGDGVFAGYSGLTTIEVDAGNPIYASVGGVLFNKTLTTLNQYPAGLTGDYAIPDSVISIGNYAFYGCSGLTDVQIGNNVTNIANGAFLYCDGLTTLAIGNNITAIGNEAFQDCSGLTSVTIPNSVTSIGSDAFYECSGLTTVTLGNSVTNIGEQAFYACFALTSVTIPKSVISIGKDAFAYNGLTNIAVNGGNPTYASAGGVLFNKTITTLTQCPAKLAGSYTIPNSVTNIGEDAFYDCYRLTNVTIGNNVATIGDWAFVLCYGLENIAFPNSVTSIGNYAFDQCSGLTNVTLDSSITNIGSKAFNQCYFLTSMTIPESVTSIGSYAFAYCRRLTNIAVNAGNPSYASSGGALFNKTITTLIQFPQGLADLAGSYTIPNSVTNVADGAFVGSSGLTPGLTNVTIGNSVTSIGNSAFWGCSGLTSVTIPNSVTSVGNNAFAGCTLLHQAYFQGNAPGVNGGPGSANNTVFAGESGTVYFLPGTTGWGATFGGWPAVAGSYQPQPRIVGPDYSLGPQSNGFQFTISWATNATVVVEASTNLANWAPVITNALFNGANVFRDLSWTNFPRRFYRVRSN